MGWLVVLAAPACVLGALIAGITSSLVRTGAPDDARHEVIQTEALLDSGELGGEIDGALRAVYPHSVVPGGVYSPDEVRDAVAKDSVVAAHYRHVSLSQVRMERVTAPRRAYMSYRIGDRIYWTKRPVALHEGESIITDGDSEIRARCGNCISEKPMEPTLESEPTDAEFERALVLPEEPLLAAGAPGQSLEQPAAPAYAAMTTPSATSVNEAGGPAFSAPGGFGSGQAMALTENPSTKEPPADPPGITSDTPDEPPTDPPSDPPSDPPGPPINPPVDPEPPVSVPEPGSLLLVGTGIAAYSMRRLLARRGSKESGQR